MIRVEFFGIPRSRAGRDWIELEAATLGEACDQLGRLLPLFGEDCIQGRRLRSGYLANINGREFTTDPQHLLEPGDCVLLLSSDVGG